jgi:hypothetical protein
MWCTGGGRLRHTWHKLDQTSPALVTCTVVCTMGPELTGICACSIYGHSSSKYTFNSTPHILYTSDPPCMTFAMYVLSCTFKDCYVCRLKITHWWLQIPACLLLDCRISSIHLSIQIFRFPPIGWHYSMRQLYLGRSGPVTDFSQPFIGWHTGWWGENS